MRRFFLSPCDKRVKATFRPYTKAVAAVFPKYFLDVFIIKSVIHYKGTTLFNNLIKKRFFQNDYFMKLLKQSPETSKNIISYLSFKKMLFH